MTPLTHFLLFLIFFQFGSAFSNDKAYWTKFSGKLKEISARDTEVWGVTKNQELYRLDGLDWEKLPGQAVRIGASPDGYSWHVNENDDIYRWDVKLREWQHNMEGKLIQISAISRDRALGVSRENEIFLWTGDRWDQLPGKAVWASIGYGDERWIVNSAEEISRWNPIKNEFDLVPGRAIMIDVFGPGNVVMTNRTQHVHILEGDSWKVLPGQAVRITSNRYFEFMLDSNDNVFISKLQSFCGLF